MDVGRRDALCGAPAQLSVIRWRVDSTRGAFVFETFPHAAVCSLMGKVVSAKGKNQVRRALLDANGIEVQHLNNIDFVDAALCALAASRLAAGESRCYGDEESGFIVVPGSPSR
jgi:predicted RNase H-like nuclease